MFGLLTKERIIAAPGYNRWRVPIASILIHLCIGSGMPEYLQPPPHTNKWRGHQRRR